MAAVFTTQPPPPGKTRRPYRRVLLRRRAPNRRRLRGPIARMHPFFWNSYFTWFCTMYHAFSCRPTAHKTNPNEPLLSLQRFHSHRQRLHHRRHQWNGPYVSQSPSSQPQSNRFRPRRWRRSINLSQSRLWTELLHPSPHSFLATRSKTSNDDVLMTASANEL